MRPAATSACPATWPPKTAAVGCWALPAKTSVSLSSSAEHGHAAPRPGCPAASRHRVGVPTSCTRIVFVEPGVVGGLPATTTTRSPDLQPPVDSSAESTCAHHVVGVLHRRHEVRLDAPGQRQLARTRASAVNASSGCTAGAARPAARGVAGLGERDQRLDAPSASPMSLAALAIAPPRRVRGVLQRAPRIVRVALDRVDDPRHRRDGCDRVLARRASRRTASPRRRRRAPRWRRRTPRRGSAASA